MEVGFLSCKKPSMLEAGVVSHCFPRRIELPINRNTAYLSSFPSVRNINFVKKIAPFKCIEEAQFLL
jgi:hypothetical protein